MHWWCASCCHLHLTESSRVWQSLFTYYTHTFFREIYVYSFYLYTHIYIRVYIDLYKCINKHNTFLSFHWQGKFTFSKVPPHPIYTSLYRYTQKGLFSPFNQGEFILANPINQQLKGEMAPVQSPFFHLHAYVQEICRFS